ncbi:glycosyltransferase 87 family protein [Streptomyces sp. CB03238]|uniref:glycosyltransferase 87 family protein n=1 Tax=Streptomyces sp. CB03238 TaxID=1907777 RepID=UPI001F4EF366|nr:glycosyltransferase 87 family protein [Streptomyces sp. CB03238]
MPIKLRLPLKRVQPGAIRRPDRRAVWAGGWTVAALWAAVFPLFSSLETHRVWGTSAAVGYAAAAIAACLSSRPRGRVVSLSLALTGAIVVPFLYLVLSGAAQSEVGVIERSGALWLQHGTPYLADPRTVTEYTPYLPGMAVLGFPRALLGDDGWVPRLLGDARLWCAAVLLVCLWAGRAALRRADADSARNAPYRTAMAVLIASPVAALPLCTSGVDLPLTGLCALALALAASRRPAAAGLALAAACALKWTAWPAVAVAVVLLAALAGRRAARTCAAIAVLGAATLILPSALLSPGPMVQQVLAFPTGAGDVETPAGSPLPGHLLAELGPLGWYAAVGLLLCGGAAVAASLLLRPPTSLVSAADRLAIGLCVAFLLAPAGRFGYLALPAVLAVWPRLVAAFGATRSRPVRTVLAARSPEPATVIASPTAGGRR